MCICLVFIVSFMLTIISRVVYNTGMLCFGVYNPWPCVYNTGMVYNPCTSNYSWFGMHNTGAVYHPGTVYYPGAVMIAYNYVAHAPVTCIAGTVYIVISVCPGPVNSYFIAAANIITGITGW